MNFVVAELTGAIPGDDQSKVLSYLREASSIPEATTAFETHYENPRSPASSSQARITDAEQAYKRFAVPIIKSFTVTPKTLTASGKARTVQAEVELEPGSAVTDYVFSASPGAGVIMHSGTSFYDDPYTGLKVSANVILPKNIYSKPKTYTIKLKVKGNGKTVPWKGTPQQVAVAAAGSSPAAVSSFTASPSTLSYTGGPVTLLAKATNATSYTFDGVSPAVAGFSTTVPSSSGTATAGVTLPTNATNASIPYTFSVSASGPGGSAGDVTTQVTVLSDVSPPAVTQFIATPPTLSSGGGSVVLSATAVSATSYTFSASPAVAGLPATVPSSAGLAMTSLSLPANAMAAPAIYTFTVSASNAHGTSSSSTTATVLGQGTANFDFDGDGNADVIARKTADGTLWLYPGNGTGNFLTQSKISASNWNQFTAVFGVNDFDGGGHADIIVRKTDGTLWLYPGNGTGSFLTQSQIGTATNWNAYDTFFSPGDFDGDGHADIVARKTSDGTLWLFPGDGVGGVGTARQISASNWNQFSAIFSPGDFNGDGHPDIIARKASDGTLWLYPGNGTGSFLAQSEISTSNWNQFSAIFSSGDFNGDGHPDIIARKASDGTLWLYPGNGTGSFLAHRQIGTGWQIFNDVF